MDPQLIEEFLDICRHHAAEAEHAIETGATESDKHAAGDMLLVWRTASERIRGRAGEDGVRDAMAGLRELMSRGLDGAAFLAANDVIEVLRELVGDSYVSTGEIARTLPDAAEVLSRSIAPEAKGRIRDQILAGRSEDLRSDLRLGMSVRNTLRSAGFTEAALGIENLDDVWYDLLRAAVGLIARGG